ncbi:MAG: hypothetical protein ABIJ96_08330 [Elusimicrobiota bacterium]
MEDPISSPNHRVGAMRRIAYTFADTANEIATINAAGYSTAETVKRLNEILLRTWRMEMEDPKAPKMQVYIRRFDDQTFIDKIWQPLDDTYGKVGLYSIEELEEKTGRMRNVQ